MLLADIYLNYKFDGSSYRIARRTSELIEAELPRDLAGYEKREPLIQLPGQTAESVHAQARAWILPRWKEHKLSHLKLETHDNDADEMTSYCIAHGGVISTHRVLRATPSQANITEDELLVATEVEQVEPTAPEEHLPRVIPDSETVPESKCRLQFVDYAEPVIANL